VNICDNFPSLISVSIRYWPLILAAGTIISASIALTQSCDQGSATAAFLPFSLVDAEKSLVIAGLSIRVPEIRKAGSSMPYRIPESSANGANQAAGFLAVQGKAPAQRVQPGAKKSLAGVNVAQAGNFALIQQESFQIAAAGSKSAGEPVPIQPGTQRFHSQGGDLGDLADLRYFVNRKQTEPSGITELQSGAVGKIQGRMDMAARLILRRRIKNAAAHAKVDQPECTRFHFRNQIFPAAMNSADHAPLEVLRELPPDWPAQRESGQANSDHALADDGFAQVAGDGFHFGQFRHFG